MKIKLFSILIIFYTFGCSDIKNQIIGIWLIKEITFNNENIKTKLLTNGIIFHENKTCFIPPLYINQTENGTWEIIKKNKSYFLSIKTSNEIFNGVYAITFYKTDKLLTMELQSKKLQLNCGKVFNQ